MNTNTPVISRRPSMESSATSRACPARFLALGLVLGLAVSTACGAEDDEGGPPAAPEMLEVAPLADGAHLTWIDASDDETEFMIMRMDVTAGGDYETVGTVPFDTTQYHDAPLTPGTTYMYMVMAVNDTGTSESNEVEVMIP